MVRIVKECAQAGSFPMTRLALPLRNGIGITIARRSACLGQRSRAARRHAVDRNALLASFVGQVVLDTGARENDDADRHALEHLVVALEGCGLGVFGPVRLEGDLRHFAVRGPDSRDVLGAPLGDPPCNSTISGCLVYI
jgi:hypothetical protein